MLSNLQMTVLQPYDILQPPMRTRCRTACKNCRKRKIKCDDGRPCAQCVERRLPCISDRERKHKTHEPRRLAMLTLHPSQHSMPDINVISTQLNQDYPSGPASFDSNPQWWYPNATLTNNETISYDIGIAGINTDPGGMSLSGSSPDAFWDTHQHRSSIDDSSEGSESSVPPIRSCHANLRPPVIDIDHEFAAAVGGVHAGNHRALSPTAPSGPYSSSFQTSPTSSHYCGMIASTNEMKMPSSHVSHRDMQHMSHMWQTAHSSRGEQGVTPVVSSWSSLAGAV